MKKSIVFVSALACLMSLVGCRKIDTTMPVFETENISRITVYHIPSHMDGIEVPSEDMEEIIQWLGTFRLTDIKVNLDEMPGANTYYFIIEYVDGTTIKNGIHTMRINHNDYELEHGTAPDCWYDIFDTEDSE